MKKLMFLAFLLPLLSQPIVFADMLISNTGIRVVDDSGDYVRFSWKCTVNSTEDGRKNAVISVSLRDDNGFQIESCVQMVQVAYGPNDFTGSSMTKTSIFRQVKDHQFTIRW